MNAYRSLVLSTLLITCGVCSAQASGPNPETYRRFVAGMVERVPDMERERLGLPAACPTYDGTSICKWDAILGKAYDVCSAMRRGESHACIAKLRLKGPEKDEAFNQALIQTAAVVICPTAASEDGGSHRSEPTNLPTGERGIHPDPKTDQEFIKRLIERLPEDERECYRQSCRTYDRGSCPLWGMSAYGDAVCGLLKSGVRPDDIEGDGFFVEADTVAIVNTAIELLCPQHRQRTQGER